MIALRDTVELVRLEAAPDRLLDGALYRDEPDGRPVTGLLFLHGKGSNFYSNLQRSLPVLLRSPACTCLALNMRCHDLGYSLTGPEEEVPGWGAPKATGGMWEDIESGHLDVACGVAALREICDGPVVVVGHSSGGFYAFDYVLRGGRPDAVALLSPLMANGTALPRWFADERARQAAVARAADLVAAGKGYEIVPLSSWYYGISAQSLLQRVGEDPNRWTDGLAASTLPLFLAWGTGESRDRAWAEAFSRSPATLKRKLEMPTPDHHFAGFEVELAAAIGSFLAEIPPPRG